MPKTSCVMMQNWRRQMPVTNKLLQMQGKTRIPLLPQLWLPSPSPCRPHPPMPPIDRRPVAAAVMACVTAMGACNEQLHYAATHKSMQISTPLHPSFQVPHPTPSPPPTPRGLHRGLGSAPQAVLTGTHPTPPLTLLPSLSFHAPPPTLHLRPRINLHLHPSQPSPAQCHAPLPRQLQLRSLQPSSATRRRHPLPTAA
jgi:hypothetical protein